MDWLHITSTSILVGGLTALLAAYFYHNHHDQRQKDHDRLTTKDEPTENKFIIKKKRKWKEKMVLDEQGKGDHESLGISCDGDGENPLPILIIYAAEYAFDEKVAERLEKTLLKSLPSLPGDEGIEKVGDVPNNLHANVRRMNLTECEMIEWEKEKIVFFIMPAGVILTEGIEFLKDMKMGSLSSIRYGLLGLGHSIYPCCGRDIIEIDQCLSDVGAVRMFPPVNVDREDWTGITQWIDECCSLLPHLNATSHYQPVISTLYFPTQPAQEREIIQCVVDVSGSEIVWEPGDALGIYPENNPNHVRDLLCLLRLDPDTRVTRPEWAYIVGEESYNDVITLWECLLKYLDMRRATPHLILHLYALCKVEVETGGDELVELEMEELSHLLADGLDEHNQQLADYLNERHLLDVLRDFPPPNPLDSSTLISLLYPLIPHYYPISSSPLMHHQICEICVEGLHYTRLTNCQSHGVAPTYCEDNTATLMEEPSDTLPTIRTCKLPVFMSPNPGFRLPTNPSVPVIILGEGLGIATCRAFIQHRCCGELQGSHGRNLLYYEGRCEDKDFVYKDELEEYASKGQLELSITLSTHSNNRLHVHDLIRRDGEKIFHLLQVEKAHVYVCGDAQCTAPDVHCALLDIIEAGFTDVPANIPTNYHGNVVRDTDLMESDDKTGRQVASKYLDSLHSEGRYQRNR